MLSLINVGKERGQVLPTTAPRKLPTLLATHPITHFFRSYLRALINFAYPDRERYPYYIDNVIHFDPNE